MFIYIIIHSGWSLAWIFMKEMVKSTFHMSLIWKQNNNPDLGEHSGSVVEGLTWHQEAVGWASQASACCVLEQDTFILA